MKNERNKKEEETGRGTGEETNVNMAKERLITDYYGSTSRKKSLEKAFDAAKKSLNADTAIVIKNKIKKKLSKNIAIKDVTKKKKKKTKMNDVPISTVKPLMNSSIKSYACGPNFESMAVRTNDGVVYNSIKAQPLNNWIMGWEGRGRGGVGGGGGVRM